MSKARFLFVPVVALVVIGLLIMGGWAIHRMGWSEGYAFAQQAAGSEAATVPYALSGLSYVALFFTAGLAFLFLLAVMGKLLRLWAWKAVGGPWMIHRMARRTRMGPSAEPWSKYWHGHHPPVPPWCWGWEKPEEEQPEKAERKPGGETSGARDES
jgi:hypothetical protein